MPARVSRAESQARTRARLLDAAARVFTARGYEGAAVDEILAAAGLSKGAFYANFPSKEALYLALLDRCLGEQERAMREIFERERTFAGRIAAIGRWAPAFMDDPRAWRLLWTDFWLHAARHPAVQVELANRYAAQRADIARLIAAQYDEIGRQPPLPAPALAAAATALVNGLIMQQLIDPAAISSDLYADALALLLGVDRQDDAPVQEGQRAGHGDMARDAAEREEGDQGRVAE